MKNFPILNRIIYLSEKKGVSLTQFDRDIGIATGAHYKWDSSKPKFETLVKIADYFSVSLDFLVGRESAADQPLDGKERRLLDLYRSMSEYGQSQLLEYAEMASARYTKKIDIPADSEEELKNA